MIYLIVSEGVVNALSLITEDAGVDHDVTYFDKDAHDGEIVADHWHAARTVIVDPVGLRLVESLHLSRRADVYVLATNMDDATIWRKAADIGACSVLWLPGHEVRLTSVLVRASLAQTIEGTTA